MATTDLYTVSGDVTNTRHAVRFLGGDVNDGVQVDAAAAALANSATTGTISAWFMVPDRTGTYCIFGAGDANVVEFISMTVEAGTIQVACTDNTTAQWDYNTAAGTVKPNVWNHVALVQDGNRVKVYLNGENMALTYTTDTTPGSWFKACAGIDGAHIGAAEEGGDAGLTKEFKGYISTTRIYTQALTQAQVKDDMSGAKPYTPHNSWELDLDYKDDGSGADDGTAVGAIIFVDANEFASRLTFGCGTPVTADAVTIAMNDRTGMAFLAQQA